MTPSDLIKRAVFLRPTESMIDAIISECAGAGIQISRVLARHCCRAAVAAYQADPPVAQSPPIGLGVSLNCWPQPMQN